MQLVISYDDRISACWRMLHSELGGRKQGNMKIQIFVLFCFNPCVLKSKVFTMPASLNLFILHLPYRTICRIETNLAGRRHCDNMLYNNYNAHTC